MRGIYLNIDASADTEEEINTIEQLINTERKYAETIHK